MKRLLFILILFCCGTLLRAQEVKFGFTVGTHAFHKMEFHQAYFSPENAYHTYHEDVEGKGVVNKFGFFNSFSFGGLISASYKRFTLNLEPQYFYQRSVLRFEDPVPTQRLLGKKAFRIPFYGTYKFFKKENSLYFMAGLIFHNENVTDIQNPGFQIYLNGANYTDEPNLGDNHFYGIFYNEKAYWSYMFGLGKITKSGVNYALRFHKRMNTENRGIIGNIINVELTISYLFISTKDFTKKHFLYFD